MIFSNFSKMSFIIAINIKETQDFRTQCKSPTNRTSIEMKNFIDRHRFIKLLFSEISF